ncbi:kunitz-type protease inhibitor 2-like [Astyanax mexicanus]|uniref:Kunitz-type protease inhibitor 2-like n=1 Tax=Astyanax mexicanus TaxID=7994 RepID=A0A8T2L0B7_ASTMX|nr:kunitz-type protease inhibitor 2-like [Astyanax mexicanus]
MALLITSIYLLCVAAALGQQDGCVWDSGAEVKQGLDPASWEAGATTAAHLPEVREDERCQAECCGRDDCQLAVIGTPADGLPECFLVNCLKDGKDVCSLVPSTQFRSYRKISSEPETRSSNISSDDCRTQKVVGNCRASFPRFYYDVTNQTCKPFTYGGCGGNNNNFLTLQECETACTGVTGDLIVVPQTIQKRRMVESGKTEDTTPTAPLPTMTSKEFAEKCQAEKKVGPCRASMPRFFYNSGTCQRFTYGGCKGNNNNYLSEEECMKTCTVTVVDDVTDTTPTTPPPKKASDEYAEKCLAPAYTGMCRGSFTMLYFDASTQSCKFFTYGGCGGNRNRYTSEEECMSQCKDGEFDEHGHRRRDRWTPAFFLVATLAVISVILLVGLLLISSRRNKKLLTITLDDKQELLPEEYPPAVETPKQ